MIRSTLFAASAFAMLATAAAGDVAPCRDAKGHFTKCAPAAAAVSAPAVTKDSKGKCHIASGPKKGHFTKC